MQGSYCMKIGKLNFSGKLVHGKLQRIHNASNEKSLENCFSKICKLLSKVEKNEIIKSHSYNLQDLCEFNNLEMIEHHKPYIDGRDDYKKYLSGISANFDSFNLEEF